MKRVYQEFKLAYLGRGYMISVSTISQRNSMLKDQDRAQKLVEAQISSLIEEEWDIHGIRTLLISMAREIGNMTVPELDTKIARQKGYEVEDRDIGTTKI